MVFSLSAPAYPIRATLILCTFFLGGGGNREAGQGDQWLPEVGDRRKFQHELFGPGKALDVLRPCSTKQSLVIA